LQWQRATICGNEVKATTVLLLLLLLLQPQKETKCLYEN